MRYLEGLIEMFPNYMFSLSPSCETAAHLDIIFLAVDAITYLIEFDLLTTVA